MQWSSADAFGLVQNTESSPFQKMSVPFNFGAAVFGGLISNIGLMKLNSMHKGT
jgi:hypothetical protein